MELHIKEGVNRNIYGTTMSVFVMHDNIYENKCEHNSPNNCQYLQSHASWSQEHLRWRSKWTVTGLQVSWLTITAIIFFTTIFKVFERWTCITRWILPTVHEEVISVPLIILASDLSLSLDVCFEKKKNCFTSCLQTLHLQISQIQISPLHHVQVCVSCLFWFFKHNLSMQHSAWLRLAYCMSHIRGCWWQMNGPEVSSRLFNFLLAV